VIRDWWTYTRELRACFDPIGRYRLNRGIKWGKKRKNARSNCGFLFVRTVSPETKRDPGYFVIFVMERERAVPKAQRRDVASYRKKNHSTKLFRPTTRPVQLPTFAFDAVRRNLWVRSGTFGRMTTRLLTGPGSRPECFRPVVGSKFFVPYVRPRKLS